MICIVSNIRTVYSKEEVVKKVLLTSEYLYFLKRNTSLFMKRGIGIYSTTTGTEALRLHEEHKFNLIFSDFNLKDMGGCKFCSLIREKESSHHVPIVLTCHNFPRRREKVEMSGANIVLDKRVEPIKLMETIGSFLGLHLGRSKRVVLEVGVFGKTGDVEFFCSSHDISNSGILIETKHQLDIGSRIILQLALPDFCHIKTKGEISRCMAALNGHYLYGVKFIAMSLSNRKAIDNYIDLMPSPKPNQMRIQQWSLQSTRSAESPVYSTKSRTPI